MSFVVGSTVTPSLDSVCLSVCLFSVQLSSLLHKKVLVVLHSEVMPHLLEPRLLLDFLVDSYDTGTYYILYSMSRY